ncbi:MAG: VCBS repeat-containing protein, partial [Sarcina sp.]
DGYKVIVISKSTNMKYTIDISDREKEYLNIIYNKNGKLKQATKATVTGISAMYPVDIDNDHIYELDCFDRVIGINNNDTLGYIETYLAWDKNKFQPIAQNLALFGMKI